MIAIAHLMPHAKTSEALLRGHAHEKAATFDMPLDMIEVSRTAAYGPLVS
jgi:hypothetical protein